MNKARKPTYVKPWFKMQKQRKFNVENDVRSDVKVQILEALKETVEEVEGTGTN